MLLIQKPTPAAIAEFIAAARGADLSYPHAGKTLTEAAPTGYTVDHNRIVIGRGRDAFDAAKLAVRAWKMFDIPWVELCYNTTPISVGETVAVLVRHFGFYSLNAARIVYLVDEPNRFGFAYGTLEDHGESGEERFSVEIDRETGDVTYDLYAFSRPNLVLAKLAVPLARNLQKRFARESLQAMQRAVKRRSSEP